LLDTDARQLLNRRLAALADGDRAAFRPIFETLWPVLYAFCRRYVGDDTAQDATQQALLRVFERASLYDPEREALPWVVAIAWNEMRTLRKRALRRRETSIEAAIEAATARGSAPSEQVAPGPSAPDLLEDAEAVAALRAVLATLPVADAETLLASAGALSRPDISGPTFRKRLERAVKRLRTAWSARDA